MLADRARPDAAGRFLLVADIRLVQAPDRAAPDLDSALFDEPFQRQREQLRIPYESDGRAHGQFRFVANSVNDCAIDVMAGTTPVSTTAILSGTDGSMTSQLMLE